MRTRVAIFQHINTGIATIVYSLKVPTKWIQFSTFFTEKLYRCVFMRILHLDPEHCFLYHLIRSLYLVNISMTGVYSGIQ